MFDFDYKSVFQELLDKNASFSGCQSNIQTLAIEICKHIHGLSPVITLNHFRVMQGTILPNLKLINDVFEYMGMTSLLGRDTRSIAKKNPTKF